MDAAWAWPSIVNKKDFISVFTALTFALSFLLIGVPLWWKTTEVYRVALPYAEIEHLPSLKVSHVIPVTVILADERLKQDALWEMLTSLSLEEYDKVRDSELLIQYAWKLRVALKDEERIIKETQNIIELDEFLNYADKIEETGVNNVLVLGKSLEFELPVPRVGCYRRGYVSYNSDLRVLGKEIISLVRKMVKADLLQKIYSPPTSYERKRPEKDRMRSLSATTAFNMAFSLIVPEPHVINPRWRIEQAIEHYIMPFVRKISHVADIDIKSQILYMTSLPLHITLHGEKGEHYLVEEQLSAIINPVEAKLGSFSSVDPTLNFVVYIPSSQQFPLYILNKSGVNIETNAFLSPQWGGFLIKNLNATGSSLPYEVMLDMSKVMGIFLSQLKLLLGLPDIEAQKDQGMHITPAATTCEWELDFLLRKNTQEQLSIAISSLYSLGQLLQTISNIVMRDDVGEKIYFALSSIKDAIYALEQGLLEEGFMNARNAFNASDAAFFDPSLLALLYFPEDQKYAIYIPLFLPISIPVIMSLKQIWNFWYENRAKKKKE